MRDELNLTYGKDCRNAQEADFGVTYCVMIPTQWPGTK